MAVYFYGFLVAKRKSGNKGGLGNKLRPVGNSGATEGRFCEGRDPGGGEKPPFERFPIV